MMAAQRHVEPYKSPADKQSRSVLLKLTPGQKETFDALARKRGMSFSRLVVSWMDLAEKQALETDPDWRSNIPTRQASSDLMRFMDCLYAELKTECRAARRVRRA